MFGEKQMMMAGSWSFGTPFCFPIHPCPCIRFVGLLIHCLSADLTQWSNWSVCSSGSSHIMLACAHWHLFWCFRVSTTSLSSSPTPSIKALLRYKVVVYTVTTKCPLTREIWRTPLASWPRVPGCDTFYVCRCLRWLHSFPRIKGGDLPLANLCHRWHPYTTVSGCSLQGICYMDASEIHTFKVAIYSFLTNKWGYPFLYLQQTLKFVCKQKCWKSGHKQHIINITLLY